MRDVEFLISLPSGSREFIVYDTCKVPAQHARMRAALERHRDMLRERLVDIDRILQSSEPERCERLMIDDAETRIDRIVLCAKREHSQRDLVLSLDAITTALSQRMKENSP